MISALHLLWIVPAAASFGCVVAAILAAAKSADDWDEPKEQFLESE